MSLYYSNVPALETITLSFSNSDLFPWLEVDWANPILTFSGTVSPINGVFSGNIEVHDLVSKLELPFTVTVTSIP